MLRKAFLMQINEDSHAEYETRHNLIWEEIVEDY